ncbi:hypothetical protein R5R35_006452 [Gryllus longicercus]|uniref:Peptidase M14 domain-containing protein n=1 Tax=Gryllus longicercus TaxID=2509291 RepID=A0AAN9W1B9_9ORTH
MYFFILNYRNIWVLEISAAPRERIGVPNVKLLGNIHGNEPLGKEMILLLAEYLLSHYTSNRRVQWLLNNTRIHLLPSANPDGFEKASVSCGELSGYRNNIRDVDLNSNFPDIFESNDIPRQEETKAIMKWLHDIPFVLSGSIHTSALVVTYPYDSKPYNITEGPSLTPDDDTFKYLASVYASTHPRMHKEAQCPTIKKKFANGTINGAEWLSKKGTMQDFNYVIHGCMELSLVISCCRYPHPADLSIYWKDNREPMLKFLSQVHMGVQGLILNGITNLTIAHAKLMIVGRNITFSSTKYGEYWRILLPGKYKIQASVKGYQTKIMDFEVKESLLDELHMTWLNITLTPCPSDEYYKLRKEICMPVTPSDKISDNKAKKEHYENENQTESFQIDHQITLPTLHGTKGDFLGQTNQRMQSLADNASPKSLNWRVVNLMTGIYLNHVTSHLWKISS